MAWGRNDHGQLGDATAEPHRRGMVRVGGLGGVTNVAGGRDFSLALKEDGTVWAWGSNDSGQLGGGTSPARAEPAPVPGLANVVALAAGGEWSLVLKAEGTVWAWGDQQTGPHQVAGLAGAIAVASGGGHALAVVAARRWWRIGHGDAGRGIALLAAPPYAATPATPQSNLVRGGAMRNGSWPSAVRALMPMLLVLTALGQSSGAAADVCAEPNSLPESACYIGTESPAGGTLEVPEDVDAYWFKVPVGGEQVQVALGDPSGVAVDAQGNVYVADTSNYRVQKLSPDGQPLDWSGFLGAAQASSLRPRAWR
jgi:hypothetical protein